MYNIRLSSWQDVADFLSQQAPGTRICVNRGFLPHPQVFLMAPTLYPPQGQLATYYKMLSPTVGFLVRDFGSYYDAQVDIRPIVEQVSLVPATESERMIAGGAALGATLGAALGRTNKSVTAGALLGGAIATLLAAAAINNQR